MTNKVRTFEYTDAKNKVTTRTAYTLHSPSDKYLSLDLTEFSDEEKEFYITILEALDEIYKAEIKKLGLGAQYRFFKEDKMRFLD